MADFPFDPKVPIRHWTDLSEFDKCRYNDLKLYFRRQQKEHLKERKTTPFASEIISILQYVDQTSHGRDNRCIVTGIGFSGPFICVNTQQLKNLVCRCKSSINSGFQQIGYDAVRNKTKAREVILATIPTLKTEPVCIRQWTVRCATESAYACFVSRWVVNKLPEILPEDFYEEKRSSKPPVPREMLEQMFRFKPAPLEVRQVEDVTFDDSEEEDQKDRGSEIKSLSMDFLSGYEDPFSLDFDFLLDTQPAKGPETESIVRSKSDFGFRKETENWIW